MAVTRLDYIPVLAAGERAFWSKVGKTGDDECWLWKTKADPSSYPALRIGARTYLAHRFSWVLSNGQEPGNKLVCHRCDTPHCVNPRHLFLGTNKDNLQDHIAKNLGGHRLLTAEERRLVGRLERVLGRENVASRLASALEVTERDIRYVLQPWGGLSKWLESIVEFLEATPEERWPERWRR